MQAKEDHMILLTGKDVGQTSYRLPGASRILKAIDKTHEEVSNMPSHFGSKTKKTENTGIRAVQLEQKFERDNHRWLHSAKKVRWEK